MDSQDNERTLISKVKVDELRGEAHVAALEQVKGPGAPRTFQLGRTSTVIGRDVGADIRIDSEELSRKHLRIMRVGDGYMCIDQESANGVFINGVKIHSAALHDGDQLQLADVVLLFRGRA
jgi:pSer/pThr/pTyr-binding forkhead associated (FHA) protein